MKIKTKYFSIGVLVLLTVLSVVALIPRLTVESLNNDIGILVDYRDVVMLSQNIKQPPNDIIKYLVSCGMTGLMVSELTGEMMDAGNLPVSYVAAEGQTGSLFVVPKDLPYADDLVGLLEFRFGVKRFDSPQGVGVVLPFTKWHREKFGVAPDLEGLFEAKKLGVPVLWRIAQALNGETQSALDTLSKILEKYGEIKLVSPVGDIALGFPNMSKLAEVLKKHNMPVAQVEFTRQLGAPQLDSFLFPNILPLHSVTQEEMTSRNLTRLALYERLIRAAAERSVRLLVFRPSLSGTTINPVEEFGKEIEMLRDGLLARGFNVKMPENVFAGVRWSASVLGALACAMAFVYAVFRYFVRNKTIKIFNIMLLAFFSILLAAAMSRFASLAALVGAFTSAFVVVEASILALENWKNPLFAALKGFVVAVVGGLAIAALFSEPLYMLRIRAFSGVKLTLLLPPLLVLLYDLHKKIHPESLRTILSRPPLWGELVLAGILLAAAGIMIFRSDNVRVVPGFEAQMREFLERTLIARPRNKEILLGFPCLLLYCYMMSKGLWAKYREILRLGVVVGFSSIVNSFCHFHTPLFFTVIRQVNGLWVGLLAGLLVVVVFHYAARPLYNRFQGIID